MKRMTAAVLTAAIVTMFAGAAVAQGPYGPGMGMGPARPDPGHPGMWMPGRMGMMYARPGGHPCHGMEATGAVAAEAVTEEKAREVAAAYVAKYFKGFTVERVLPFEGRWATAYRVELKGPNGEMRVLHVNPWGRVHPFGPLAATN
jgi:hypothetical protein